MKITFFIRLLIILVIFNQKLSGQTLPKKVSREVMEKTYAEIKTPFKYGLVLVPPDATKKIDCPTVFRKGHRWYMTYLVFDGRGYETWLARSNDLLSWVTMGRILSFSDSTAWDDVLFWCILANKKRCRCLQPFCLFL